MSVDVAAAAFDGRIALATADGVALLYLDEWIGALAELVRGAGRQWVRVWCASSEDVERLYFAAFAEDDIPTARPYPVRKTTEPRLAVPKFGRYGMCGAQWGGRCAVSSLEGWVSLRSDQLPAVAEPEARAARVLAVVAGLRSVVHDLGADFRTTAGATAVHLWSRSRRGRWTWHRWADPNFQHTDWEGEAHKGQVGHLDWLRKAVYGGRCETLHAPVDARGVLCPRDVAEVEHGAAYVIHRPGERAPYADRWGVREIPMPAGWRIHKLDIASAYPAIMTRKLPNPWAGIDDEFNLNAHGVTECTVRLLDAPPVIPVRTVVHGEAALHWPRRGTYRAIWPNTALWAACKDGRAEILHVYRSVTFPYSDRPMRDTALALWEARHSTTDDVLAEGLKMAGRALYGKMGQHRATWALVPLCSLPDNNDAPEIDGARVLKVAGHWADWALVLMEAPEHHAHACPPIAAEITAVCAYWLAQAERAIESAGGVALYVDTDCIICAGPWESLDEIPLRIGVQLGDWKHECSPQWAAIFEPKRYVLETGHIAAAGIPEEIAARVMHGERVHTTRATTLREHLARGRLLHATVEQTFEVW